MTEATLIVRLNRIRRMLHNRDASTPAEFWLDFCSGHLERLIDEISGESRVAWETSAFVLELAERLGRCGDGN